MYHYIVGCIEDQITCPNLNFSCKYKQEYMLCIKGAYAGKCMLASAACDNIEMCIGEDYISECSKLETVFNLFCYILWYEHC